MYRFFAYHMSVLLKIFFRLSKNFRYYVKYQWLSNLLLGHDLGTGANTYLCTPKLEEMSLVIRFITTKYIVTL